MQMYYVLYSPSRNQYVNVEGDFAGFADAEKHEQPWFTPTLDDANWVGPCEEGVEPRDYENSRCTQVSLLSG